MGNSQLTNERVADIVDFDDVGGGGGGGGGGVQEFTLTGVFCHCYSCCDVTNIAIYKSIICLIKYSFFV